MNKLSARTLLGPSDPSPVEVLNADSHTPIFLLCEHAGKAIPASLGDLGVTECVLSSHRAWDIGAEALARAIAELLAAPLVIQRYSRLVIDCNRPPSSALSVPSESDGAQMPRNKTATSPELDARVAEIFDPLNATIEELLSRHERRVAFSIHSFTPQMGGEERPWHAGLLSGTDLQTAHALRDHISARRMDLNLAINQPYKIEPESDWFIPAHAEPRGLMHSLIEVRNDQLSDTAGVTVWADLLAAAIQSTVEA